MISLSSDHEVTDETIDTPQNSIYPMQYNGEVVSVEFTGENESPFNVVIMGFVFRWTPAVERVMRMPKFCAELLLGTDIAELSDFIRFTGKPTLRISQSIEPDEKCSL